MLRFAPRLALIASALFFNELMTRDTRLKLPILASAIGLSLAALSFSASWQLLERKGFDLLSVVTAPRASTLPITIVGIDEPSFAEIGLRWPWPRSVHAKLIDKLTEAGAAVIAFDVILSEASEPEQDKALADAIKNSGRVVLASDLVYQETNYVRQWIRVDPLNQFGQAGAGSGLAGMTLDGDMVIRRLPDNGDAFWRAILARFNQVLPGMLPEIRAPADGLIRYLGPDHTYPYVSYYQALNAEAALPKDFFRDQIVLIGRDIKASPDAGSAQADSFATPFLPFTGWLMPGVEIHATVLENVVAGLVLREAPRGAALGLLAAAILCAAFGMRAWRPLLSALLGVMLMAGIAALAWGLFRYQNLWLPSGSALCAVVLMYVGQGGIAFINEQHRKLQIRRAFEHYVPPLVVAEMVAHPERLILGGVRREVTLLFTDLKGFTVISEQMKPEDVSQLLNRHLTEMTEIILRHNGTVTKFIGDAVMAFWGAPLDDPQQALHACRAAQEMQAAMAIMRKRLAEEGLPALHMRIGIHSGIAIVGNMGSTRRFEYSAIGDTVNLAARLEGVNKLYGTEAIISGTTAAQLPPDFPLRRVDKVRVKGKNEPVEIFTFCGDSALCSLHEDALAAYRERRWQQSEDAWRKLLGTAPEDGIAALYLQRIGEMRGTPPTDEWDGTVSLEKM